MSKKAKGYWFHPRLADEETEAGYTVSKRQTLPEGDFQIDEYIWPSVTLWFVTADDFTDDQRQAAYRGFIAEALERSAP